MRPNIRPSRRFLTTALICALAITFSFLTFGDALWATIKLSRVRASAYPLSFTPGREIKLALVSPASSVNSNIVAGYSQVLKEEGFAFDILTHEALMDSSPDELKVKYAALVLPEEVNAYLPDAAVNVVRLYLHRSGKVFCGAKVASLTRDGASVTAWPFAQVAGISGFEGSYSGPWVIPKSSPIRAYFDEGLFNEDKIRIYGFPDFSEERPELKGVSAAVLAYGTTDLNPEQALVTRKDISGGGVFFYVNSKPGLQKTKGNNDFLLRDLLKYFLIEVVRLPRMVASPGAKGGLVIGIHVCSGVYFQHLDKIFASNLFTKEFPYSFAVTAGPDCNKPGDGKGVDAGNPDKGLPYVKRLTQYGAVGSHGGWIHNYWALSYNLIPSETRKEYIDKNYRVLEQAIGKKVTEYAAPGGIHSQELNNYIAAWGTRAASIPSCYFSPPTHGWFDGKPETRFWLFGYTGLQQGTAIENMMMEKTPAWVMEAGLKDLVDTVVRRREIRLFYSHPMSVSVLPHVWLSFQNKVAAHVRNGDLTVRTMTDFADFLDRHALVHYSFIREKDGYTVIAKSTSSLKEISFALPLNPDTQASTDDSRIALETKDRWTYATVTQDIREISFKVREIRTKTK